MNPILCPVRNAKELTKRAYATFAAQDVGQLAILFIDNASTDGTGPWLDSLDVHVIHNLTPMGVAQSWNTGLRWWFTHGAEHVLVVNNDVELQPSTYRRLLEDGGGFVTAVSVDSREQLVDTDPRGVRPHPDFSCYLIRREVWDLVGGFDENFKVAYAEDNDYHLRLHKAGVFAHCVGLPFYHFASGTIKNAAPDEVERLQQAQRANGKYFYEKWGFAPGTPEYYAAFQ